MTPKSDLPLFSIYYGGISKTKPDDNINIEKLIELLTSPLTKNLIQQIRLLNNEDIDELKKERNKLKKNLIYVTPAGTFFERKKKGIIEPSGLVPIDIDDVEDLESLKGKLIEDKYVKLLFTSPSGNGLKLFIEIPKTVVEYPDRVKSFYNYLETEYNISLKSLDASTHDISRACYLSYDESYYYNPDNAVYKEISQTNEVTVVKAKDNTRSAAEFREIIKLLYIGKSKEEIYDHMMMFDKWKTSHPAYKEHTYDKAVEYVAINPPNAKEKTDLINDLVDLIMEKFYIYTIRSDKHPDVYIYHDGIYVDNGKAYIQEFIEKCIGKYYTKVFAEKVIEKIMVKTYIAANDFFTEPDPKYICVDNGILNIFTKQLLEFTPKVRFFNKLPVTFDVNAKPTVTIEHFKNILKPEDVPLMQELYGFLLFRNYKFQKAFMFSGDGGNGKSITTAQIKTLIGIENTVNISLETLESDRGHFMKIQLHKKMVNLADDIGKSKLNETRTFKEITGGNIITTDKKGSDAITFVNYAKMVFNANQIPLIDDDSDGFWRRWIVIRFDMSFLETPEYERKKERGELHDNHRVADTSIIDKLTTPEELSGVLNWAIVGFERLIEQNGFSYHKSLEETRKYMRRFSSSVIAFTGDCTETIQDPNQYEIVSEMYKEYIKYCFSRKKRVHPESELKFRKLLEEEIPLERKRTANGWEIRAMFTKLKPVIEEI